MTLAKFLISVILLVECRVFSFTPIVLWHGIGDDHLNSIKQIIKNYVNETVYIKSIQIGESSEIDFKSGFFIHPNKQIADVCREISADENLNHGFHAIGFSQGAQFL